MITSDSILESIHDQPPETSNHIAATENTSTDLLCLSNQTCPPVLSTNVSFPPTLLLDSIILKEVCENIFKDLNKLVKTRNNFVHEKDYVNKWTRLGNIVYFVMCELQKISSEEYDKAMTTLND